MVADSACAKPTSVPILFAGIRSKSWGRAVAGSFFTACCASEFRCRRRCAISCVARLDLLPSNTVFRHDARLCGGPLLMRVVHDCFVERVRRISISTRAACSDRWKPDVAPWLLRRRDRCPPDSIIVDRLRDESIVLDIGAHHGEFALPLAYEMKTRRWSSKVWSFEPDPENFRVLQHNVSTNGLGAHAELRMGGRERPINGLHRIALPVRQQRQHAFTQRRVCHRRRASHRHATPGQDYVRIDDRFRPCPHCDRQDRYSRQRGGRAPRRHGDTHGTSRSSSSKSWRAGRGRLTWNAYSAASVIRFMDSPNREARAGS